MSIFKRLSTTLVSRVDQVVGEIENHDAVIQATLDEMRKKIAQAKVNLTQVQREETKLKRQIETCENDRQRWRERAVTSAKTDESKALLCLQRSQQCDKEIVRLKQSLDTYQQTSQQLSQDISQSEAQLAEMSQKQTLMRARQSSSAALNTTNKAIDDDNRQLEDTFDRWEVKVCQAEMRNDSHPVIDPVEQAFIAEEEQDELRQQLAGLLAEEKKS